MPVARQNRQPVPARPLYSDLPGEPGVYHSVHRLGDRWVYYAMGNAGEMLACRYPNPFESDDDVEDELWDVVRNEPRVPALALVNADAIIAAGLSPRTHRSFSLPRRRR